MNRSGLFSVFFLAFLLAASMAMASPYYGEQKAVVIGINDYPAQPLHFAEQDAREFARILEERYGFEVRQLLGSQADRMAILNTCRELAASLDDDGVLLVFFSGHGFTATVDETRRMGFVLPAGMALPRSGAHPLDLVETAVSFEDLTATALDSRARHVLFFIDACFSGAVGNVVKGGYGLDFEQADLAAARLMKRPSRVAISAGTAGEEAIEDRSLGHGLFSHSLLTVLDQDSAGLPLIEVFKSVRDRVVIESENRMSPMMSPLSTRSGGQYIFVPRGRRLQLPSSVEGEGIPIRDSNIKGWHWTDLEDLVETFDAVPYRTGEAIFERDRYWRRRREQFVADASLGNAYGAAALFYCESKGLGDRPDSTAAFRWAELANDSGHPAGAHVLGESYFHGIGVARKSLVGTRMLERNADDGFPLSVISNSVLLLSEADNEEQLLPILDDLRGVASAGSLKGIYFLARGLFNAPRELQNWNTILEKLSPYLDREHPLAQHLASVLYGFEGPLQDPERSASYLKKAARAGYAESQALLSYRTLADEARLRTREKRMARTFAEAAASQGNVLGMYCHALCLGNGWGGGRNIEKAVPLMEEAARLGVHQAYLQLGTWYSYGGSFPRDDRRSLEYLNKAASAGNVEAHLRLGQMMASGRPRGLLHAETATNLAAMRPQAIFHFVRAARLGDEDAREWVRILCEEFGRDRWLHGRGCQMVPFTARKIWKEKLATREDLIWFHGYCRENCKQYRFSVQVEDMNEFE